MKKFKLFAKANLVTLLFFIMSLTSVTFAWFAFSNVVKNEMEIEILAWNISMNDGDNDIQNSIDMNISQFYPGMPTYSKTLEITNNGDVEAEFVYGINSIRLLDNELSVENQTELLSDLSQSYPFTINFAISSPFIGAHQTSIFTITVDWPLDSGNNAADTLWGNNAYVFAKNHEDMASLAMNVSLTTKQYINNEESSSIDKNFLLGSIYYMNPTTKNSCTLPADNCYLYYVVDSNNLLSDTKVKMVSLTKPTYSVVFESLPNNTLNGYTILSALSKDIVDTKIVIPTYSDRILGAITSSSSANSIYNKIAQNNGKVVYSSLVYNYFASSSCYWINQSYNSNYAFAFKNGANDTTEIYKTEKSNSCKYLEVLEVPKENIIIPEI